VRPAYGAKPLEMQALRKILEDRRMWCGLGLVVKRDGETSHFEIETDDSGNPSDVLVEVDLMPEGIPVTARLGCGAGSLGSGGWKIPAPGTEVVWMAPHGEMEADVMIVGTLATRAVPGALDADTYVLVQPKNLIIASQDGSGKVKVGSPDGSGTEPAVLGNSLETRLSDLESKFTAHVHAIPALAVALPPAVPSPITATGTTAATTSTLPHSGDNIKAANVEVK
jgi:hypothetical protein